MQQPKSGASTPRTNPPNPNAAPPQHLPQHARSDSQVELADALADTQWLLEAYGIKPKHPFQSLRQCSSSFFVILSQRLFHTPLRDVHDPPDTYEKKLANIQVVISALESVLARKLDHISAHEIVMLNEYHISYLIRVFVQLAAHIQEAEGEGDAAGGLVAPNAGGTTAAAASGAAPVAAAAEPEPQPEGSLNESEVTEVTEEISDADSAEATQHRVAAWKQSIVPPADEAAQVALMRHDMRELAATLNRFDRLRANKRPTTATSGAGAARANSSATSGGSTKRKATSATNRPSRTASRAPTSTCYMPGKSAPKSRVKGSMHPSGFDMMASLPKNKSESESRQRILERDFRIERLKQQRLIEEADREIRSGLESQISLAEATMADFGRQVVKQQRRDLADMKKFARDEDAIYREAYMKVVVAKRQKMVNKAKLAKDELYYDPTNVAAVLRAERNRDVSTSFGMENHSVDANPTDIVLAAKKALAEYAIVSRRDMADEYDRYRHSMTHWRSMVTA